MPRDSMVKTSGETKSNNRVTLAVISTKLDIICEKLDALVAQQREDHNRLIRAEGDICVLRERISLWQAGQAGLSLVLSAVAAFLGMRR